MLISIKEMIDLGIKISIRRKHIEFEFPYTMNNYYVKNYSIVGKNIEIKNSRDKKKLSKVIKLYRELHDHIDGKGRVIWR